jgi:hypothetical protein
MWGELRLSGSNGVGDHPFCVALAGRVEWIIDRAAAQTLHAVPPA